MHKLVAIAVLTLCVLAHFPFRTGGEEGPSDSARAAHVDFTYDDRDFVENNASIRSFDTAWAAAFSAFPPEQPERGLYRPLTTLSYAMDYALFADDALGYHGVNVGLYLVLVLLVLALANRWFDNARVAFAAALIFAVHPVHCEAVDSISGRSELLSLGFGLASWLLFDLATQCGNRRSSLAIASAFLYACASLSKETGVLLPAVLVLHLLARDGAPEGFGAFVRKALDQTSLHIGIAFFYLALRHTVLGSFGPAAPVLADIDFPTRLLTMGTVFIEYLRLLTFPTTLQLDFYYQQVIRIPEHLSLRILAGWSAMLGLVGAFAAATTAALRSDSRLSPPVRRALVAGLGSFFVFLLPVSHVLGIGALMAERFLFAPSLGFVFAVVGLTSLGLARLSSQENVQRLIGATLLVVIGVAGVLRSNDRATEWRDGVKLWESAAVSAPHDYRSYSNIATHWINRGNYDEAEQALRRALVLVPTDRTINVNLSVVLLEQGELDAAAAIHEQLLRENPSDFMAWYNLGNVELRRFQQSKAITHFKKTLSVNPNFAPASDALDAASRQIDSARKFLLLAKERARTSEDGELLSSYARACRMTGDYACAAKYDARAAKARN